MTEPQNPGMWELLTLPDDESTEKIRKGIVSGSHRRLMAYAETLCEALDQQRSSVGDGVPKEHREVDLALAQLNELTQQPPVDSTMRDAERILRATMALEEARDTESCSDQWLMIAYAHNTMCGDDTGMVFGDDERGAVRCGYDTGAVS